MNKILENMIGSFILSLSLRGVSSRSNLSNSCTISTDCFVEKTSPRNDSVICYKRRIFTATYIVISLFTFLPNIISAQSISATAGTDSSDYLIGDYINFSIRVEHANGIRVTPPTLTDKLGQLEVIKVNSVTKGEGFEQFNYIISGYDSLRAVIPPLPIEYFIGTISEPQITKTNEVVVFIHTLEVNANEEIKDVKQPIRIELDWEFWLLLALGILIAFALAYYLFRRFRKPKDAGRRIRTAPLLPGHAIALNALDELNQKKLWQQGKVKEYNTEITEIIRKYFEHRYSFNSLEKTTDETMSVLNNLMDNEKMIGITSSFLHNADMVKFAKFQPMPTVNEEMMVQALEIVEKTKRDDDVQIKPKQNGVKSV